MGICSTFHATILIIAATIYLTLGLAITAASAATFFTPYGKIFTPIYAGSGIGGGVLILIVAIIGYIAACKRGKCSLGLYMFFDLLIIVLIIIAVILMFRYEDVLNLATQANLDDEVKGGLAALSDAETTVVRDVVTKSFSACAGNTTYNATDEMYSFACSDSAFSGLGEAVDSCMHDGVNATIGTIMYSCYTSENWPPATPLNMPATVQNVLPVLQTPKGLYCACASAIMNEFILKYIGIAKWVGIGVAVFFVLIFLSCCWLCCSPNRKEKQPEANMRQVEFTPGGWSAGSSGSGKQKAGYGKSGKYGGDAAYIAKP